MVIKNLVISGCGPIALRYLGCIKHLIQNNYFSINDIEKIYCTSGGIIVAISIILGYSFETLEEYYVKRPWNEVYKVGAKQILGLYKSKGLFGKKQFEQSLNPLLKGKNLNPDINLKELYEITKVKLIVNSVSMNKKRKIKTEYFDHISHPELKLCDIIQMTCAIPFLIEPLIHNDNFYLDGGVLINYNSKICLDENKNSECLGFNYCIEHNQDKDSNNSETNLNNSETNLLDFFSLYNWSVISLIVDQNKGPPLENEIKSCLKSSPFETNFFNEFVNSKDLRKSLIDQGEEDGKKFLDSRI